MEPENDGLEDVSPFAGVFNPGSKLIFSGVFW